MRGALQKMLLFNPSAGISKGGDLSQESRYLFIVILGGILLRLFFLHEYIETNPFFLYPLLDSRLYLDWADAIHAGVPFFAEEYHHPPGYAFFLAAILRLSGGNLYAVLFTQNLLVAVQSWIVFKSGKVMAGSGTAWVGLALFTISGPIIFYSFKILSETLYITFLLASFYFILLYTRQVPDWKGVWFVVLTGIFIGLAAETRGNGLICVVVPLAIILRSAAPFQRKVSFCGPLLAALLITMSPVLIRNYQVAGILSPVASNWGENFYFANHPEATGSFSSAPGIALSLSGQIQDVRREASRRAGRDLSAAEAQRFWFLQGWSFITGDPVVWAKLELEKIRRLFRWREASSIYFFDLESENFQPSLKLMFAGFGPLTILFWCGLFAAPKLERLHVALGYLAVQVILLLIFWPELRFCLPLIPFLCMVGGNIVFLNSATFQNKARLAVAAAGIAICFVSNATGVYGTGGREAWYTNTSAAFFASGDTNRAVEMARNAIAINPRYTDAWINLGAALERSGNLAEARTAWYRALQVSPENITSLRNLALSFESTDKAMALNWWQKTLVAAEKQQVAPEIKSAIAFRIRELQQSGSTHR